MKRIPKSAPTLERMDNGLNQPDARTTILAGNQCGRMHSFRQAMGMRVWANLVTENRPIPRAGLHGVTP